MPEFADLHRQRQHARVNINYHIAFDTNYYSVPYNLVQLTGWPGGWLRH
jgi:hypothetical protein